MGKEMIFFRDSCTRVRDLERENKELVKQASIDKKTLMTLREVGNTVSELYYNPLLASNKILALSLCIMVPLYFNIVH